MEVKEKKNIKLYYEAGEGEFYWVIDWVEKNNCDKETPKVIGSLGEINTCRLERGHKHRIRYKN